MPGVKPGMAAVGLLLFTVMGDPPPLRGATVNVYLVYVTPGGGMAVAVPAVGLVACTLVSVGAAAGEVVNVSGAEGGLVVPGLTATTCTISNGVSSTPVTHSARLQDWNKLSIPFELSEQKEQGINCMGLSVARFGQARHCSGGNSTYRDCVRGGGGEAGCDATGWVCARGSHTGGTISRAQRHGVGCPGATGGWCDGDGSDGGSGGLRIDAWRTANSLQPTQKTGSRAVPVPVHN